MRFDVRISAKAEQDLNSVLEWLTSQHTGTAATAWLSALEEAIQSLEEFPGRCIVAPENRMFSYEVRQLFYGRKPHIYRILFRIVGSTVYVLHIRHGRRRPVSHRD